MNKEEMFHYLDSESQRFYDLSDQIWENAEVRFQEHESAKAIADFLKKLDNRNQVKFL